jgi:hypothetical protein
MRRRGTHSGTYWKSQKESSHVEDLNEDERIILKRILEKKDWVILTGLTWLKMGSSGGLL